MPLLWLRISVLFYGLGLLYALSAVSRPCSWLARNIAPLVGFGMIFHFVSLAETAMISGHLRLTAMSVYDSESLLAFLILAVFHDRLRQIQDDHTGHLRFPARLPDGIRGRPRTTAP